MKHVSIFQYHLNVYNFQIIFEKLLILFPYSWIFVLYQIFAIIKDMAINILTSSLEKNSLELTQGNWVLGVKSVTV